MRAFSSRQRKAKKRTVLARDGAQCALCKRPVEPGELILKRIIHRALGGSGCLDNLHLICHPCNRGGPRTRKAATE